ncbi:hypothetical protein [Flavobacterium collinsii]|uniref:Uncharacterized protein n=1 Tax=Flavobacterium collinsii TaxID=1114861 RepID=A0A9W4TEX7_9FLAO|nr:hypothetical protein [Flavobacterium collinsii]CAI2766744.1 conserved protein of unknown function [Flavobacterium collinsii]
MPALSEYSNVHNTVINIITNKGYKIWYNKKNETYYAEKNGWDFMAYSPCSLLGIISIFEHKKPQSYKEYWWKDEGALVEENLSKHSHSYISVTEKNNKDEKHYKF